MRRKLAPTLLLAAASLAGACAGQVMPGDNGKDPPHLDGGLNAAPDAATIPESEILARRQLDYGQALRTASLKLLGELPRLDDSYAIQRSADPRTVYEERIDAYLADPRFARQLVAFHRDVFKMGGPGGNNRPTRETAPVFAAMVVATDRPYTDVFTAKSGTCPSFDAATGAFTAADCANDSPVTAGVLTDPGMQSHYFASMAFRRARWVQETFACRKFPAEYSPAPTPMGAGQYTSPWPFASIAGGEDARIDFHDTSAVICANCHSTMNHLAPLFGNYDANGRWMATIQVTTPITGLPETRLADWLVSGERTSWRMGVEVSDLGQLGQALARDPDVVDCTVARVWNFAMSKGDIVADLATVPDSLLAPLRDTYQRTNYSLKVTLRQAFTSDDFTKF